MADRILWTGIKRFCTVTVFVLYFCTVLVFANIVSKPEPCHILCSEIIMKFKCLFILLK